MNRSVNPVVWMTVALGCAALAACDSKPAPAPAPAPAKPAATTPPAGEKPADAQSSKEEDHDHGHGPTVELGTAKAGPFDLKASRDGDVAAGKETPVDVWVTGGPGKPAAVRAWIGGQDGKGSMKTKLELEKDNYHHHVEVPNPLDAAAKLWVEIEDSAGTKHVVGFDLKK